SSNLSQSSKLRCITKQSSNGIRTKSSSSSLLSNFGSNVSVKEYVLSVSSSKFFFSIKDTHCSRSDGLNGIPFIIHTVNLTREINNSIQGLSDAFTRFEIEAESLELCTVHMDSL